MCHRVPVLICLVLAACERQPSIVAGDGGAGPDMAPDQQALPYQSCSAGWVTTHLTGPETTTSFHLGERPGAPLRLASGPRALFHRVGSELTRCTRSTGCLALARLGEINQERLHRRGLHLVEQIRGRHIILALEPGANLASALREGAIEAVDLLRPKDKLPPLPPGAPPDARTRVGRVALLADAQGQLRRRTFAQLGLPLTAAGERKAAAMRWVYRVAAERTPDGFLDADVRRSTRAEEVQGFTLDGDRPVYTGYSGDGITVAVVDSGVDENHLDLHAFDAAGQDLGTRVTGAPVTSGAWSSHGTAVASVLAGNGYNSVGFVLDGKPGDPFQWRGQAPRVGQIISTYRGTPWTDILKAQLSNHSYALSYGTYNGTCAFVDQALYAGLTYNNVTSPPHPMIWAAGNAGLLREASTDPVGYYSLTAVAKNPIVVGGCNANDDSFSPWASHGPTLDGRIKPDLVAPSGKDHRPPAGIPAEIDEIRLVAKPGSGASDRIWSFDNDGDLEGWNAGPGIEQPNVQGGSLRMLLTLGGDAQGPSPPAIGGGELSRSGLAIKGSDHDTLVVTMRLQVKAEPGRYRWPNLWALHWTNDGVDHTHMAPFAAAKRTDGWQTHTAKLPTMTFKGTISALRIEPVFYISGIVVAQAKSQSYQVVAGTSYAAPAVSGVVALLLEQLAQERKVDLARAAPWPSTVKSLLIHTARDMVHEKADARDRNNPDTGKPTLFHPGPDFATGFGLVDGKTASDLLGVSGSDARKMVEESIDSKQTHTYRLALSSKVAIKELRATLVWDDPPGSPVLEMDQRQLVNDLDLVLVAPSGTAHGPWVLDPLPWDKKVASTGIDPIKPTDVKPARRCAEPVPWQKASCEDHRNNVEQVVVDRPESGHWTVVIRGFAVPRGPQRYSLVVSAACD